MNSLLYCLIRLQEGSDLHTKDSHPKPKFGDCSLFYCLIGLQEGSDLHTKGSHPKPKFGDCSLFYCLIGLQKAVTCTQEALNRNTPSSGLFTFLLPNQATRRQRPAYNKLPPETQVRGSRWELVVLRSLNAFLAHLNLLTPPSQN